MDALFCSVINVISVNGFFKSLHILLPLSLMSLHGICTRGKQELERDKAEPRRCGIKSIVSERYTCTGKSLLRWGPLLGNLTGRPKGLFPNVIASIRKSFLLEGVNMETRRGTALDRALYLASLWIIFTVNLPSPPCPCDKNWQPFLCLLGPALSSPCLPRTF